MKPVLFIIFLASVAGNKTVPLPKCGVNEYALPCKTLCPPQNCDIAYTSYLCDPKPKCISGCDCIKGHLRNSDKICIPADSCPGPKKLGQIPVVSLPDNTSNIPPQPTKTPTSSETCNTQSSSKSSSTSTASSSSSSTSSSSSSTSSSSSSSASSSYSSSSSGNGTAGGGTPRDCTLRRCTPTCSLPSPQNCPENSNPCNCPPGTIISEKGGKCVQMQEYPKYSNCKGDYNASYTDCLIAYPSTCGQPNAQYRDTKCGKLACQCNPGYLLSKKNGKCIKPEDCPGGKVCAKNQEFVYCSVACPNNYCPTDDGRYIIACDPPYPCPSGCSCKANHRIKSDKERVCILASDCPPVKCTRPNEVWNPCPKPCFSDSCSSRNAKPKECPSYARYCDPQCVCKDGFFRNGTEICVTAKECPAEN